MAKDTKFEAASAISPVSADKNDFLAMASHALAIATPVAFVFSAAAQALDFRISYGLNYFSLATPGDVLMGSFKAIPLFFAGYVVWLPLMFLLAKKAPTHARRGTVGGMIFGTLCGLVLFFVLAGIDALGPNGLGPARHATTTNLRVAFRSDVMAQCQRAPVLWLGSSSAVLNCQGRVTVLHNLEGVVTERVR